MAGVIQGLELFDQDSLVNGALDKSLVERSLKDDAFFKPNSPIKWYLEGVDRISLVNDLVKSGEIPEGFEDAIRELLIIQAHHDHINKKFEEIKEKIDINDQTAMADFAKLLLDQKELSDILISKYRSIMDEYGSKLEELKMIIQKIKIISDDTAARIIITML